MFCLYHGKTNRLHIYCVLIILCFKTCHVPKQTTVCRIQIYGTHFCLNHYKTKERGYQNKNVYSNISEKRREIIVLWILKSVRVRTERKCDTAQLFTSIYYNIL